MDWTYDAEVPPNVELVINSFEAPADFGEPLARWVENVRDAIMTPLVTEIRRLSRDGPPRNDLISDFGVPGGSHVSLSGEARGALRIYEDRQENWERLTKLLNEGRLRRFDYQACVLDEWASPSPTSCELNFDFEFLEEFGTAHLLGIWASRTLFDSAGGFTRAAQERWVAAAKRLAVLSGAATGYITLDHTSFSESPYERSIGVDVLAKCDEWLRGYFWGNFLTERHIAKLGGIKHIKKHAPCYLVEEVAGSKRQIIFLQLTPSLEDVPDDALRELKSFLEPVLPRGRPNNVYIGPRLRLV